MSKFVHSLELAGLVSWLPPFVAMVLVNVIAFFMALFFGMAIALGSQLLFGLNRRSR